MVPSLEAKQHLPDWGEQSLKRLQGIDSRLRRVLEETRRRAGVPFEITEGLRDRDRQAKLVEAGKSQTMNSKHLHGGATDIYIPDGKGGVNWDFEAYRPIADIAKEVSKEFGYDDFVWGGDWKTLKDGVHFQMTGSPQEDHGPRVANTPLAKLADEMREGSTSYNKVAAKIADASVRTHEENRRLTFMPHQTQTPPGPQQQMMGSSGPLSFGGAPYAIDTFQPGDIANKVAKGSMAATHSPAGSPNQVDTSAFGTQETAPDAPSKSAKEEEEGGGWFANLAGKMFKDAEDPSQKLKDLIGGVGVGLGQMSAGQPVDLSGHFERLATQRQNSLDSINALQEQTLAESRLALDQAKHGLDVDKFKAELDGASGVDYAGLAVSYPELSHFIQAAQAGDEEAQKKLWASVADRVHSKAVDPAGVENALSMLRDPSADPAKVMRAFGELTPQDRGMVSELSGLMGNEPNKVKELRGMQEHLASTFPEKYDSPADAFDDASELVKSGLGLDTLLSNQIEAEARLADIQAYREDVEASNIKVAAAGDLDVLLAASTAASVALEAAGSSTGSYSGAVRDFYSLLDSFQLEDARAYAERLLNVDKKYLDTLSEDGTMFMYSIAQQYDMLGRGFTPEEAKMLMSVSPTEMNSFEGRTRIQARLYAESTLTHAKHAVITGPGVTAENYRKTKAQHASDLAKLKPILSTRYDYGIRARVKGKPENGYAQVAAISEANGQTPAQGFSALKASNEAKYEAGEYTEEQYNAWLANHNLSIKAYLNYHYPAMSPSQYRLVRDHIPGAMGFYNEKTGEYVEDEEFN